MVVRVACALGAMLLLASAGAGLQVEHVADLPDPREWAAGLSDGTYVYHVGGFHEDGPTTFDEILRFDPGTNTVSATNMSLPDASRAGAAVWDPAGQKGYYFVEITCGSGTGVLVPCLAAYEMDPAAGSVVELATPRLFLSNVGPFQSGMAGFAAVWGPDPVADACPDGCAYVFAPAGRVVRYDPSSGVLTPLSKLPHDPSGLDGMSAVWHDGAAYLFGGGDIIGGGVTDAIHRYDPQEDNLTVMQAKLPAPRAQSKAFLLGDTIYIAGGVQFPDQVYLDDILSYDPVADALADTGAKLPQPAAFGASGDADGIGYILGGYGPTGSTHASVLALRPSNLPPLADAGADVKVIDDGDGTERVRLDGSASRDPDGRIVEHAWTLGGQEVATGATPEVELAVGNHMLHLRVTDDRGATADDRVRVLVEAADVAVDPDGDRNRSSPPVAAATFACERLACDFDATGSTVAAVPAVFDWSFGDGASAEGAQVEHLYGAAGRYEVVLHLTDATGAQDQTALQVEVHGADVPHQEETTPPVPLLALALLLAGCVWMRRT